MNVAFSYSWLLHAADLVQVRAIIEKLRQHAVELGGTVGDVAVLTGEDAQVVQPEARQAVLFAATIPGASEGKYGLASAGNSSWWWNWVVVVSDVRRVGELHAAAADLGLEVAEVYAGMIFTSRKNASGVVEVDQRQAFDMTDF